MITTTNMSLTAWDQNSDPYSHSQLSNNFIAIDNHDHTSGKGLPITTDAIDDGSITTAKLADNAISTIKIQDASVTPAKLTVGPKPVYLGACVPFWRPSPSTPLPDANNSIWRVADGSLCLAADHDFPGVLDIPLPDLRNRFVLGAVASGGGAEVGSNPAIGLTGGSHVKDLSHRHSVDGRNVHRFFDDDRDYDEVGDILIRNRSYGYWPWGLSWWGYSVTLRTDKQGSTAQDIRPNYIGLLWYVQVKEA